MKRKIYVCLPFHSRSNNGPFVTMVYAGTEHPRTDGDVLEVNYSDGRFESADLIEEEDG